MEHFYNTIGEDWFTYQELYSNMVNYFPDNALFVEIGSWKGRSTSYMAVEIHNSEKNIKFDCVDTWNGSEEHLDPNSYWFQPELVNDKNWLYRVFLENTKPVNHIINPIRTTSLEAAQYYEDRSIDFVFIDAAHDYENVKADLNAWYPKVKKGGFIGGHDYDLNWYGVVKGINEVLGEPDLIFRDNSWIKKIL
jgi:cephalosporin hydroxylase